MVRRSGKFKSNFIISAVPTLWNLRMLPMESKKVRIRRETSAVSGMRVMIMHQNRHRKPLPSEPSMTRGGSASRRRSVTGRSQTCRILRQPCRYNLKGPCTRSLCEYWHPPERQFHKTESGCTAGDKCLFPHSKVREGAVAIVKTVPQLGCVSHDSETSGPPKSAKYLGNPRHKVLGSIRRVRFTQSTLRQASIEDRGPSPGKLQDQIPHQRSPYALKFQDGSREETERQEWCARGDAWRLPKNMLSLTTEWSLPAPSVIKPEEREFVVDSVTSMHMLSRKDLNSAELEPVRVSKSPTTVVAASGEVQTKEEATVYVKEFDLFVTVKHLEDISALLPLGKLCEDHGYFYQKLKTLVKRRKDQKLRLRNFDARQGKIETGAVAKGRKGLSGVERGRGFCYPWREKGQCSKGD